MCTAISYTPLDHYFGRNLDLPAGYTEQVTITPRNFAFHFRNGLQQNTHYAMIGMATVANEYPLYYEATNEKGLSMAALNFPGFAAYQIRVCGKDNIAPFELIPWVLGQCQNVQEARKLLQKCSLWMLPYNREYKLTPLHWILSDRESSLVAEPLPNGLAIFDNPVGVLTNAPSFPYHMHRLSDFASLDNRPPSRLFGAKTSLPTAPDKEQLDFRAIIPLCPGSSRPLISNVMPSAKAMSRIMCVASSTCSKA